MRLLVWLRYAQGESHFRRVMGVHHISWIATSSGVCDAKVLADAMCWLVGDGEAISLEQSQSHHGTTIHMVEAVFKRSGKATRSLARLGPTALDLLSEEISERITEDNELHIRLDLLELIGGRIKITKPGRRATVKGKTKFEVYPGDDSIVVARETLTHAREEALRLGLPEDASIERQTVIYTTTQSDEQVKS